MVTKETLDELARQIVIATSELAKLRYIRQEAYNKIIFEEGGWITDGSIPEKADGVYQRLLNDKVYFSRCIKSVWQCFGKTAGAALRINTPSELQNLPWRRLSTVMY